MTIPPAKALWRTRRNDVPNSCPIRYSVNGKRYLAETVGHGEAQAATCPPLVPEIQNPPGGAAQIWVFSCPIRVLSKLACSFRDSIAPTAGSFQA
jgi:hypothetical protein